MMYESKENEGEKRGYKAPKLRTYGKVEELTGQQLPTPTLLFPDPELRGSLHQTGLGPYGS